MNSNSNFESLLGSEDVELHGLHEQKYAGKLYLKTHLSFDFEKNDVVCITNSTKDTNDEWQHHLIKSFRPQSTEQVSDYDDIQTGAHFIVFRLGNVWSSVDNFVEITNSPDWK